MIKRTLAGKKYKKKTRNGQADEINLGNDRVSVKTVRGGCRPHRSRLWRYLHYTFLAASSLGVAVHTRLRLLDGEGRDLEKTKTEPGDDAADFSFRNWDPHTASGIVCCDSSSGLTL